MDYVGAVFRPPSEADSLLVQVTVGCSHNACTFCGMYRDKRFLTKPRERVRADLLEGLRDRRFRRVFLMDGDVLILSTERLLEILALIREHGPHIERVSVYGDARGVLHKSDAELSALREAGLGMVYHGMESGSDAVLRLLNKGADAASQIEAGRRLKAAGILYSAIVLLGAGGVELSEEHASETARALSLADPDYAGALMLTLVPGTPLFEEARAGRFVLPDKWGLLAELRTLVAGLTLSKCRFSANHASNYLPLRGEFPKDKSAILNILDQALAERDDSRLKPEWLRGL